MIRNDSQFINTDRLMPALRLFWLKSSVVYINGIVPLTNKIIFVKAINTINLWLSIYCLPNPIAYPITAIAIQTILR